MANETYTTYREWVDLQDLSSYSGSLPSSDGAIYYSSSSLHVNNPLEMDSNKITGLAAPVASTDAATKLYVDTAVSDNNQWTLSDGSNSTSIDAGDTATFSGTTNEIAVEEDAGTLTISLPDDVTIGDELTVTGRAVVGGKLDVTGSSYFAAMSSSAALNCGAGATFQGGIRPGFDGGYDLGSSARQWKDLYLDANARVGGRMHVTGAMTAASTVSGSGAATFASLASDSVDLTGDYEVPAGSSIDGAGTFDFSGGTLTLAADQISGDKVEGGTIAAITITDASITTLASAMDCDSQAMTNVDIDSGTIDGATIATSDITVGAGKTLDVSAGTLTLAANQISGDKVEGGTIAAITINALDALTVDVANEAHFAGRMHVTGAMTAGSTVSGSSSATFASLASDSVDLTGDFEVPASSAIDGAGTFDVSGGTFTTSVAQNLAKLTSGIANNDRDQDFGGYDLRASTLTADSMTATNVAFYGANGLLAGDTDMQFSDNTLTVTKLGAFQAVGAIDFNSQAMTNVDINSGTGNFSALSGTTGQLSSLTINFGLDVTANGAFITGSSGLLGDLDMVGDFDLNGDLTLPSDHEVKAQRFVTYSDAALKTNVETVDNAMDMIQGLRGVSYDLKADGTREYGFIAQEVNEVVPEVVSTSGNLMGIDYTRITSLLVEAVKTQQAEIIALQEKLDK